MISSQAGAAFFFGILSAISLVMGAALGIAGRPPQRAVAGTMAFGAGALLSALAFELVLVAFLKGGVVPVVVGSIIGGVAFIAMNEALNGRGGFLRKHSTTSRYLRQRRQEEVERLLEKLSRVPLMRALPPEELQAMVPHMETVSQAAGSTIFRQGDPGDALYVVDQGTVELRARPARAPAAEEPKDGDAALGEPIALLRSGGVFGEMALLTGEGRTATAMAVTDVALLRMPKDDFDELLAVSPSLSRAVGELLARNLAATTAQQIGAGHDAERWQKIALRYVDAHTLAVTPQEARGLLKEHSGSAAMGIFLGLLLDGIPESLVIGMSMIGAPAVSPALIVGLFLSNFPEALSSAAGMKAQGASVLRIMGMWTFLTLFTGVGAFLGNVLFLDASKPLIAGFEAAAAGAMLTMIAETALPEAYEHGGWVSGLATLLGFLAAFSVRALSGGH